MTGQSPDPLRILMTSDSALIGDGLAALLDGRDDVTVLGRARDPEDLADLVVDLEPDVVLISLRTGTASAMRVIRATRELREVHPDVGIMIISDRANGVALEVLRSGSAHTAYLLDDQLPNVDSLVLALRGVLLGQTVLDAGVVDALVRRRDAVSVDHLTVRELEVLEQIAHGLSNRAVAAELRITLKAVENHVTSIFRKLQLTERSDVHQRVTAALTYLARTHQRPAGE